MERPSDWASGCLGLHSPTGHQGVLRDTLPQFPCSKPLVTMYESASQAHAVCFRYKSPIFITEKGEWVFPFCICGINIKKFKAISSEWHCQKAAELNISGPPPAKHKMWAFSPASVFPELCTEAKGCMEEGFLGLPLRREAPGSFLSLGLGVALALVTPAHRVCGGLVHAAAQHSAPGAPASPETTSPCSEERGEEDVREHGQGQGWAGPARRVSTHASSHTANCYINYNVLCTTWTKRSS